MEDLEKPNNSTKENMSLAANSNKENTAKPTSQIDKTIVRGDDEDMLVLVKESYMSKDFYEKRAARGSGRPRWVALEELEPIPGTAGYYKFRGTSKLLRDKLERGRRDE